MFSFLYSALAGLVAVFSAVLTFFGFVPGVVVAPDLPVPTPIVIEDTLPSEIEQDSLAEVATSSEEVVFEPSSTEDSQPLVENYEQSLKEALDALAALQKSPTSSGAIVDINTITRNAVVNILCTTAGAGPLNPISASGVVIDPRGVVLTNAHAAQYFLLENYPREGFVECVVRVGSPATTAYRAELLFLPPSWVAQNAEKIDDERPTGNGEHDYAFLLLTETISGDSLSVPLPYLPLALDAPLQDSSVLLAGYPAGFLGGATIAKELYAASANARVGTFYTFDVNTVDLFSIGGSVVAQQGSSGGAVSEENAQSPVNAALIGLIVTSSDAPDTASRDLRALSTEYIIRDFGVERGVPLVQFLGRDLALEQVLFSQTTAPALTRQLTTVLER